MGNCVKFPKQQCDSLTWYTTVLIGLVVLSISSDALDFTYSRVWSPSSVSLLAEMNCFALNIETVSAIRCSTFCIENEEICLAFVFNVLNQKCFMCRSSTMDGLKFNTVYSPDTHAYKIGKLLMLTILIEPIGPFIATSNDKQLSSICAQLYEFICCETTTMKIIIFINNTYVSLSLVCLSWY